MERSCEGMVLVHLFRLSNSEPEVAKFTYTSLISEITTWWEMNDYVNYLEKDENQFQNEMSMCVMFISK